MIQLQGLTSRRFKRLSFDRFDSGGKKVASDDRGLGASFPGGYDFKGSEDYFSFFDVDLSPGTNTFVFHGTDEFGNQMTTNIVIVFSTADDHTPPLIEVRWPGPNDELAGPNYMIQGRMDDFTAKLEARVRTKDGSTTREALVERNGCFWVENIPLALGANQITLIAKDAAGNSSETNFTVFGHEGPVITMHPVNPRTCGKRSLPSPAVSPHPTTMSGSMVCKPRWNPTEPGRPNASQCFPPTAGLLLFKCPRFPSAARRRTKQE